MAARRWAGQDPVLPRLADRDSAARLLAAASGPCHLQVRGLVPSLFSGIASERGGVQVDSVPPRGGLALAAADLAGVDSATVASVSAGVDSGSAADAGAADLALAGADSDGAWGSVGAGIRGYGIRGGDGAACGLLLTGMSRIGAGPATITMGRMAARLMDHPTVTEIPPTTTIIRIRMPILIRAQISTTTRRA